MAKDIKKQKVVKVKKKEEVVVDPGSVIDPDMPMNKQRHLKT